MMKKQIKRIVTLMLGFVLLCGAAPAEDEEIGIESLWEETDAENDEVDIESLVEEGTDEYGEDILPELPEKDSRTVKKLDNKLQSILKRYATVGASVVVAKDGHVIYQYNYGTADKKAKHKVDDNTYFRIASVTKFVTGIHVMQLVEKGLLDPDEDISTYLGYKVRNPWYPQIPLTLRMIMCHTTSLNPGGYYYKDEQGLKRLIVKGGKGTRSNYYHTKPGSTYRYSNFAAGLMGSLIEAVTGKNVYDSIREDLFEPLGIDAAYNAGLLQDADDVAGLYYNRKNGKTYMTREESLAQEWDSGVDPEMHYRITIGSMWIRARDLCRLGAMMCAGGVCDGQRILQEDTVREMMSVQAGKGGVTSEKTPYGLCVHREQTLLEGKTVYGHQGLYEDLLCNVYYEPESRFVFVVASNGCRNQMDNRVASVTRKLFQETWEILGEPEEE